LPPPCHFDIILFVIKKATKQGDKKMVEKNTRKEKAKRQRVFFDMNTGTRTHENKKHPSRQNLKKELQKMLDN
jgi:hypothetical protein